MSTDVDGTGVLPSMSRLLKSVASRGADGGLLLLLSRGEDACLLADEELWKGVQGQITVARGRGKKGAARGRGDFAVVEVEKEL
ncbi:uncharacterized protein SPSK_08200 [Sporothrix schenckii 1099-18]|uniref:Uncharacterized protein n=1 Tax=Sporothrix schenckii 1099-18 TaxID=1397361 RepID=A0A0F2MFJ4_SPOSC|nr:uncharacterized protein SPSK_08200 [Sporothrix schenckii 1099-18]KJR88412.1 hypothetical protein SPSK_08200 [Sporothrix schenckii 1099-18]